MVFHLEPNCGEIRDVPTRISNNDPEMGYVSLKKHPRSEEDGSDDDQEDMELSRKKKAKKNNSETEADSSSSDHSCFEALVTASSLHEDALYLPKDFTSSNGFQSECCKIVLTDGGEKAWALDLRFNNSSDTFYISRGWRSFCDENRKEAGGLFVFKLVGKGEMPLLSFCPAETREEKESKKESLPVKPSSGNKKHKEEIENNNLRSRDSTPSSENRFVTLTFTRDAERNFRLRLPLPFMRENCLDRPGMITLVGKDGTKWLSNRIREATGRMSLKKGWKEFAKANGLKTGVSFTLESIWENGTPMLRLFNIDSTSSRGQQGEHRSKASEKEHVSTESGKGEMPLLSFCPAESRGEEASKKESLPVEPSSGKKISKEEIETFKDSTPPSQNRFVTLTFTHDSDRNFRQHLPLPSQGDSASSRVQQGEYRSKASEKEHVSTESGKGEMPLLTFCPAESRGGKASKKESLHVKPSCGNKIRKEETKNNYLRFDLSSQNRFVTLTFTHDTDKNSRQRLPLPFMRENCLDIPGMITLVGKDGTKWLVNRIREGTGRMSLKKGWKEFAKANGLKTGESFTLESIWENGTPMLSLFSTESTSSRVQQGDYCSKASEKEHVSTELGKGEMPLLSFSHAKSNGEKASKKESIPVEHSSGNKISKEEIENSYLRFRDSTPPSQNRFVTLTFSHDTNKNFRQRLPLSFLQENCLDIPGMITMLGIDGTKWLVNRIRDAMGRMSLGKGWKEFAKANGLKTGESFTLESTWENGTPMLRLFSIDSTSSRGQQGECCLKDSEKEHVSTNLGKGKMPLLSFSPAESRQEKASKKKSLSIEPSSGNKITKEEIENNYLRFRDSIPPSQNRFVTLNFTRDTDRNFRQHLPLPFLQENCLNIPGMITLVGKDGTKWLANRIRDATGRMSLGKGWKAFANANYLKIGQSFTLESIWENGTPMLRLFDADSTSTRGQQGEYCSKANEKEHVSTEPSRGNKISKVKNSKEEMRESSSAIQN